MLKLHNELCTWIGFSCRLYNVDKGVFLYFSNVIVLTMISVPVFVCSKRRKSNYLGIK